MLDPGDDDWRLFLRASLVDLQNIDGNALSQLLGGDRTLGGSERALSGARKLIRTHALSRVRLDD
jgi:hypothetical protein